MEVLPDRDDLILQYNDRIAVVEIKGVLRKSAAERHAAQLEKWVSSYFSDKGIRPKGILGCHPELCVKISSKQGGKETRVEQKT